MFESSDGGYFHATFACDRDRDTWTWRMDAEQGGKRTLFARVELTRR